MTPSLKSSHCHSMPPSSSLSTARVLDVTFPPLLLPPRVPPHHALCSWVADVIKQAVRAASECRHLGHGLEHVPRHGIVECGGSLYRLCGGHQRGMRSVS